MTSKVTTSCRRASVTLHILNRDILSHVWSFMAPGRVAGIRLDRVVLVWEVWSDREERLRVVGYVCDVVENAARFHRITQNVRV